MLDVGASAIHFSASALVDLICNRRVGEALNDDLPAEWNAKLFTQGVAFLRETD